MPVFIYTCVKCQPLELFLPLGGGSLHTSSSTGLVTCILLSGTVKTMFGNTHTWDVIAHNKLEDVYFSEMLLKNDVLN